MTDTPQEALSRVTRQFEEFAGNAYDAARAIERLIVAHLRSLPSEPKVEPGEGDADADGVVSLLRRSSDGRRGYKEGLRAAIGMTNDAIRLVTDAMDRQDEIERNTAWLETLPKSLGGTKTEAHPPGEGEKHDAGHPHLIAGEFQSDKYPTTPRGKVPLSCKDPTAQDLLWTYAQRRRAVDAEFATDLEIALRNHGYEPHPPGALDLTDERVTEIIETLRMFANATLDSLKPRDVDTEEDVLASNWPEGVRALRDAAEYSSYVPNSLKWRRMADELEAWGRRQDRAIMKEPTPPAASETAKCKHCGTTDEVTTRDGETICLSCLVEHHPPGNAGASGAKCEDCRGDGFGYTAADCVTRGGVCGTCHGTGARPSPETSERDRCSVCCLRGHQHMPGCEIGENLKSEDKPSPTVSILETVGEGDASETAGPGRLYELIQARKGNPVGIGWGQSPPWSQLTGPIREECIAAYRFVRAESEQEITRLRRELQSVLQDESELETEREKGEATIRGLTHERDEWERIAKLNSERVLKLEGERAESELRDEEASVIQSPESGPSPDKTGLAK